ncbi:F-box protein, partial [Trifolium medium]|nr:F-box protein [Trifolium medium]
EFVYSVLLKLDSIKSFRLKVGYDNSDLENIGFPSVAKWVDHVVQRGVENLCLTLIASIDMKLPIRILSCRTLVTLNLFGFVVKGFSSVRLPSLKVLRFDTCTLQNNRDLVLFLDGCPILEDLDLHTLEFVSEDSLTYQECKSLSLSKLTKARMPWVSCHFPLEALYNVEELHLQINKV